jgi:hypothetical protein
MSAAGIIKGVAVAMAEFETFERDCSSACVSLDQGKQGTEQPRWLVDGGWLRVLETQGLAEYGGETGSRKGWRLTLAGKSRVKALRAAARASTAGGSSS